MVVRPATVADVPWLVDQCSRFADEWDGMHLLPEDPEEAAFQITYWIEHGQYVHIAEAGGGCRVGFLIAFVGPHPFSLKLTTASEALWWVVPSARKGRAGLVLMDEYLKWAEENVDFYTFSLSRATGDAALVRRGLRCVERVYAQELPRWKRGKASGKV